MFAKIKSWFQSFVASFHDSEVLVWARLQFIMGIVWTVLSRTDLSPIITNPQFLAYWLIINGVITELLRRNRADDFKKE